MEQKYSWFKNEEEANKYTVIHTENNVTTLIAITDTAEKADIIAKACNILNYDNF